MIDARTVEWITSVLSNDETSSDEELINYFEKEGKMSRKNAKRWVALRDYFMGWKTIKS